MQDYSPIQYKVIQKLFPCRKTVLGDASQSVNPYGSSTADMIHKALVTGDVMKLFTVLLVRSLLLHRKYGQIPILNQSHGTRERKVLQFNNELSAIKELIATYQTSAYKSLGLSAKPNRKPVRWQINYKFDIHFLSSQSSAFYRVLLSSAHMAKGLEFDEVIIHRWMRNYIIRDRPGII